MIEPEIAFADLFDVMDNAEAYVKYVVQAARAQCPGDFEFFASMIDKDLPARLDVLVSEPFQRVQYTDAVALLQAEIAKDPSKWEFPVVEFGTDLASEHERWLTEKHFQKPVFVYNYPRTIKSFYMRDNDDGTRAPPPPAAEAADASTPGSD
jgi:asparaginyl-tRNA synthetase